MGRNSGGVREYFATRNGAGAPTGPAVKKTLFTFEGEVQRKYGSMEGFYDEMRKRSEKYNLSYDKEVEKHTQSMKERVKLSNEVTDYLSEHRDVIIKRYEHVMDILSVDRNQGLKDAWPLSRFMRAAQQDVIDYAEQHPRSWASEESLRKATNRLVINITNYREKQELLKRYGKTDFR